MERSTLGDRMKTYEAVPKLHLMPRTPIIVRLDGRAFHTFTKKMPRPFYEPLHKLMVETAKFLVSEVDTCVFAYTQSDEISLLLKDWANIKTSQWFDGNLEKIVSNTAALATGIFNKLAPDYLDEEYLVKSLGFFDSRAFNLPMSEVCNYFIWRQQDATRNSINSVGQANFSHKELHGKNVNEVQEMLITKKDVNWNDFPTWAKRGTSVVFGQGLPFLNRGVYIDSEIPVFTQDREYVDRLLAVSDNE